MHERQVMEIFGIDGEIHHDSIFDWTDKHGIAISTVFLKKEGKEVEFEQAEKVGFVADISEQEFYENFELGLRVSGLHEDDDFVLLIDYQSGEILDKSGEFPDGLFEMLIEKIQSRRT